MLRLYNTLTRKIEEFKPLKPTEVGYYSCGPTVYDYAHIGHARTYIFADILQRTLEFNGFNVKRVMNITDVGHLTSDSDTGEDKMEKGAAREKKSVWDLAKFYTNDFFAMMQKLNIKKPEIICKATDYVTSMIKLIGALEKKGFTYKIDDGIYFDTSKFRDYGRLTGQTLDQLQKSLKAGARVEMVSGKKHPTDFALWKLTPKDIKRQMEWDSPWGKGFPGWHIECSAMSMEFLGETFDIHTGGVDHIQIHHSNEIAQSEAATGTKFVRYWLHGQHLLVDAEKMSKSLGNFYRVEEVEKKGFNPLALRYLFLTAHYRTQMNFTWKAMEATQNALDNLYEQISAILEQAENGHFRFLKSEITAQGSSFQSKFKQAINDDLNTPQALSVLWEMLKSDMTVDHKYDLALVFDQVLGLSLKEVKVRKQKTISISEKININIIGKIPDEVIQLVKSREKARQKNNFTEADKLRRQIERKGISIEDTSSGPVVRIQ